MHKRLQAIISAGGGGVYRGLQRIPTDRAYLLVYFDSPATGSTMAMKVKGLTVEKVRQHIKESNAKLGLC